MTNIIFDWSGTISDDWLPVYKTCMHIFEEYDIKIISKEEFQKEFTLPYMNFWNKYLINPNKDELDIKFREQLIKEDSPSIYPGVHKTIKKLYSIGCKMLVFSSVPNVILLKEAKKYNLINFFIETYGSIHDKTASIKKIMKDNNFNPKQTLYLGDMTHDIEAGKKAGVKTIAITWGYESEAKLKQAIPDYIIKTMPELMNLTPFSKL
jgi:phosphoglycolate phosphatase